MKFGYNFSNQWLKDPFNYSEERAFKLLSGINMDCLEIQLAVLGIIDNKGNINNAQKEKIITLLKKYKINVGSVHAPYPYYVSNYLNFKKGMLHKRAIKSLKNCIKLAKQLAAKVVVIHPSHTLGFYKNDVENEKNITETIVENLSIIKDYIETNKFDIKIGIETMAPKKDRVVVGDRPQEIVNIIKSLDSKKIGATWDMCHAYRSLIKYNLKIKDFKELAKYTYHIHYSSYSPILSQCHCPTNYGREKPIQKMISLLRDYNGIVINEISPIMLIYLNPKRTLKQWFNLIIKQSREDFKKWMH
ncbi:MAG: sugar phosphate isomerase/epimerase [Candidatus Aminicenantes bacterium]|nr:sugar phosphate isomerase/epimerase [Candidatus Aminicenantes bacterium]